MTSDLARAGDTLVVQACGRRLAARRIAAQAGAGPPPATLVFLHEGLGSIAQWRDFPDVLCGALGLPGLVYERWGFGASEPLELPRPRDYLEREAECFLPEVLAACGIAHPVLIGHSDGGTIALLYAAAFPERPLAVVTEAAHVFVEEVTLAGIHAAAALWDQGSLKTGLARHHGAQAETVFHGWAETWLRADFRDWNMVDRLAAIKSPILVVQGADDEYGTAAQIEAIVAGVSGPATALMVPACGHSPHHQQRDRMLEAMAEFLRPQLGTVRPRPRTG